MSTFVFSNSRHVRRGMERVARYSCKYLQLCEEVSEILKSEKVRDFLKDWDEKQSRKRRASISLEETERRVRARHSSINNPDMLGETSEELMEDDESLVEDEISDEEVEYEEEEEEEDGCDEEENDEEEGEEEPVKDEESVEEEPLEEWTEQEPVEEPLEEEPIEEEPLDEEESFEEEEPIEEEPSEEEPIEEEPSEGLVEQEPLDEHLKEELAEDQPVEEVLSSCTSSCDFPKPDEVIEEDSSLYQVLSEEEIFL